MRSLSLRQRSIFSNIISSTRHREVLPPTVAAGHGVVDQRAASINTDGEKLCAWHSHAHNGWRARQRRNQLCGWRSRHIHAASDSRAAARSSIGVGQKLAALPLSAADGAVKTRRTPATSIAVRRDQHRLASGLADADDADMRGVDLFQPLR